ncbi:MAG: T9SS type A sorting domain-containing protein, partial [Bacteroidales bacterium]
HETILTGNSNHDIGLGEGEVLGGYWTISTATSITALSDIRFTGGYSFENNYYIGDFNLNGATLYMDGFSINTTGTVIFNGTIEGNFEILGVFDVNKYVTDTLHFIGDVTVTDTMQSQEYGGGLGIQKLRIDGNITNNGVVRDREDTDNPDELNILVTGNIINHGIWSCMHVNLIGAETQIISQSQGTHFESNFYDLNAASDIWAESDIHMGLNFDLNGATLNMQYHTLQMGGWLYDGTISNATLRGGYLQDITSISHLAIEGIVTCDNGNLFKDLVYIQDTLQSNEYGGGSTYYDVEIEGNIQNHGVIRNINSGDMLRLHISGNIENQGEWLHAETILNGSLLQKLEQSEGSSFSGNFIDSDSTSYIYALSDLSFTGNINLGRSLLDMGGHTLTLDGWLHNGYLNNSILNGGIIQNITSSSSLRIEGKVTLDAGNCFNHFVFVDDTLQSNEYGGGSTYFDLVIDGDLTNLGVIQNINNGDMLRVFLKGNLTNHGIWANKLLYLNGTSDQHLTLIENMPIECEVNFDAMLSTAPFQWMWEGNVLISEDFEGEDAQVLSWNVPVEQSAYGTFYCETGGGNSRNIVIEQGLFQPVSLHAETDCLNAVFTWGMEGGNPDGYNVYKDQELLANVDTAFYTDEFLMPDEIYLYYVTALWGEDESGPSSILSVTLPLPDSLAPTSLNAIQEESHVLLTWAAPNACLSVDGYNIYRNNQKINDELILDPEFMDTPGHGDFEYQIKAVYYFGESDPSEVAVIHLSGVEELWKEKIRLYPNPVSHILTVESEYKIDLYQVFSANGQQLISYMPGSKSISLDVQEYETGLYFILLQSEEGSVMMKFAVK